MGLSSDLIKQSQKLEQAYQAFLESKLDSEIGRDLAQMLEQVGLTDDSHVLAAYCDCGSHVVSELEWGTFGKRRCFVGMNLPLEANSGDLWFDIVELTPMLLIPAQNTSSIDMREWVSVRPVFIWQFKTFLKLADWHLTKKDFMKVTDLMDINRFKSTNNSMKYATNVYHEEAVAYAHWFGKQLTGQFALENVRAFTTSAQFFRILPENLRLWDGAEYSSSEFVRIAVGQDTLDKDPDDEFELREAGKTKSLVDRMLFEEWERSSEIGFSTAISLQIGLIQNLPRLGYEFLELRNAAFRL
jgi:hypothetical protein